MENKTLSSKIFKSSGYNSSLEDLKVIKNIDVKEFIQEGLNDFDLTCVKAGDLPKDMNVTAFKDVLNAYNRFKKRAGDKLI